MCNGCRVTKPFSSPRASAQGWKDASTPVPAPSILPTAVTSAVSTFVGEAGLVQHWQHHGLSAGSKSQKGMWVSHQEINFSTMSFELFEPQILLPAQLFSPSRSSLCFLSRETGGRGADSSIAGGQSGGSRRAGGEHPSGLQVCKQIKPQGAWPRCSSIHEQRVPAAKPTGSLPIHNPGHSAPPKHVHLSPARGHPCSPLHPPQMHGVNCQHQARGKHWPKAAGKSRHTQRSFLAAVNHLRG